MCTPFEIRRKRERGNHVEEAEQPETNDLFVTLCETNEIENSNETHYTTITTHFKWDFVYLRTFALIVHTPSTQNGLY